MNYEDLIKQAEIHYIAREILHAIDCATQAIDLDKTKIEGYYWRGRSHWYVGAEYDACKDADMLLACAYFTAFHLACRVWAFCVKKDYEQAISECSKALRQDDSVKEAYYYRAWAYRELKKYDRAIDDYSKTIALAPNYAEAHNWRGNAYFGKGDYDSAIADYDEAIKIDPKYATTYNSRGTAYSNKGVLDHAIADYDKAIVLNPNIAFAYYNRGNAYSNKGDHDRAIEDYDKAIELDPNIAFAYFNRANEYIKKGNCDCAIQDYGKAIELDPKDADAYRNRGFTYFQKANYKNAIMDYAKSIEFGRSEQMYIDDFLKAVLLYRESIDKFTTDELCNSPHHLVNLVGEILLVINEEDDYSKFIRLIREVYKLQEDLGKQENTIPYFYQYSKAHPFVDFIGKSSSIWLTPACYQNDPDEGKFIFEYFSLSSSHERLSNLLKGLTSEELTLKPIAFIRSFSECKDDLLMWNRSYGEIGAGVSLGVPFHKKLQKANARPTDNKGSLMPPVDRSEEEKVNPAHEPTKNENPLIPMENLCFARVLYLTTDGTNDCQDDIARFEPIKKELENFTDKFLEIPENVEFAKEFLSQIFLPISHLVKNATYKHEREWRLLYITFIHQGKKTGYIKREPVLHIETEKILFTDRENKEELWLGPKISDLERLKIKHLFEYDEKYDFVSIYPSKIRFRE